MKTSEILVVGAGPTGLALALQAHDHGAHVRVIERRAEAFRPSRALIMHPPTLEALRPLGVTEALLAKANIAPEGRLRVGRHEVRARLSELALPDTTFPHLSLVRQMDVETVLTQALADRGVEVERETELVEAWDGVATARATVQSRRGSEHVECDFIAGCDGPESAVRRSSGVFWCGGPYQQEIVLADIELDVELAREAVHVVVGRRGLVFLFALGEQATWRLLATRPSGAETLPYGQPGPAVPRADLQATLDAAGFDARITMVVWSARYRVQHRLADRFRRGRLFLVGDAAHAFSPATGQGMNAGIQDATNLGWKLAYAPSSTDCRGLLDSYERERRPTDRDALAMTHLAFWGEAATGPLPSLLRGVLVPIGAPAIPLFLGQRLLVAEAIRWISRLRVAYDDSPLSLEGVPRLWTGTRPGRRLQDRTVSVDGQWVRLHTLTSRPGIHLLLGRDAADLDARAFGERVAIHRLSSEPGRGVVAVRPDGYVGFRCGLADARQLRMWLASVGALS